MRFSVDEYTSSWQDLEIGIIIGCTMSVIIFAAEVSLLIKSTENIKRGVVLLSGTFQSPTSAFMNEVTVITRTNQQGRWMLTDLHSVFTWVRIKFKPAKSRALVIKKGKPQRGIFKIDGIPILTVHEKAIRSLAKWFDIVGGAEKNMFNYQWHQF